MPNPKQQLNKRTFNRPSPALINFDYTDVASRQGYVLFDGFTDSSGSYHLSGDAERSTDAFITSGSVNGSTDELGTFETSEFNYPALMKGTVFFMFAADSTSGAGVGTDAGYIQIAFYHNDTLLTTLNSQTIGGEKTEGQSPENVVLSYELTSTRNIKIGDQLKVKVTAGEAGGGRACVLKVGTDPTGASSTPIDTSVDGCSSSRFILAVPFKIDI